MTKEELLECCETDEQRQKINHSFKICESTGRTSSYTIAENKEQLMVKFQLEDEAKEKKSFNKAISNALECGKSYAELTKLINDNVNSIAKKELNEKITKLNKELVSLQKKLAELS